MREQCFVRHALTGAEQGIPELAGAVGKAGYIHSITPAEIGSLEISMTRKEIGGVVGRVKPAQQHPQIIIKGTRGFNESRGRQWKDYNIVIES